MLKQLRVSIGQYSDKGRKEANQDFHGACLPREPRLTLKGIAVALADGISSSQVSRTASEAAVKSFLEDYYCTSEAWSVKTSARRVLMAANSWLHAQTQQSRYRFDKDRGYVCTLSAMVLKSTTAHVFHVGDARIYRLRDEALEQLTVDHRVWVSREQSRLSRALGVDGQLEIDYRALSLEAGDLFVLVTDGVYEYVPAERMRDAIRAHANDLDAAARTIAAGAFEAGSPDNLTVQIVRIDEVPQPQAREVRRRLSELPFPPVLRPRATLDGYEILRELHASHRSHVYLARDGDTGEVVALKTPSVDSRDDRAYLERFLMEDWVARRIDNAHVLKARGEQRRRNCLYVVAEFVDGQTLTQWMADHPKPIETVRGIVEQIARGLRAFHRLEMLHRDLRPDNVMIDRNGTVKIIDFGSVRVAGVVEIATPIERRELPGAAAYAAPEYFLGESGSARSDLYSLGVIAYQMLCGKLPYGGRTPRARTRAAQRRLVYRSVRDGGREIPGWIDGALRKAVHPDPARRYGELSEFLYDLRHPDKTRLEERCVPWMERDPTAFWRGVSLVLATAVVVLLYLWNGR